MKTHNRYSYFWPRYRDDYVRSLLRADALVAARFEPVYSQRFDAYLDVLFEQDGKWLILPMLRTEGTSLVVPEHPPITWPETYARFEGQETAAIEERLVPWLRSITFARLVNDEQIRFFRDDTRLRAAFDAARAASWLGAAMYEEVARTAGAFLYAARFAANRRVALRGAGALNGAALLSNVAASVEVEAIDEAARAGLRTWFAGVVTHAARRDEAFDLYVGPREGAIVATHAIYNGEPSVDERKVEFATPIAIELLCSFDPEDAPPVDAFAVPEFAVPVRHPLHGEPPAGGGSHGRIRIVISDETLRLPDADADAAQTLAGRLRKEGFDAKVLPASAVDVNDTDLIHVFGLRHGVALVQLLRSAEAVRVPIVTTTYADDRLGEAFLGCQSSVILPRNGIDQGTFDEYAAALAVRKISGLGQGGNWYDDASAVLLQRSATAIVSCAAEAQFLSERLGYTGATVPVAATVSYEPGTSNIGSLVGPDEYVLIHAPIERRLNQLFAVLAARKAGLRLVLLGPVADAEYYRYLNEVVGSETIQLRDSALSGAEIAGIYGRARVVADVSWSANGLHRLARGASVGAALVATPNGYANEVWGDLVTVADPGNIDGIAAAFRTAWERQPHLQSAIVNRTLERCEPFAGLVGVVAAYQGALGIKA